MSEPKITRRKITDYRPDPANPNAGSERGYRMVDDSFRQNGAGRSLVVTADDTIVAGNTSQEVAVDAGLENVIEVETDGKTVVVVKRTDWPSIDDPRARRYSLSDNRTSNFMEWDAAILAQLQAENAALLEGLWRDDELAELLAGLETEVDHGVEKGAKPNPRKLPLDVIFTFHNWYDGYVGMALASGLKWGIHSEKFWLTIDNPPYPVTFIDNDYFNYDHDIHAGVVSRFKPKYATVRDIMTREQCAAENISFFELEQILDWAEELSHYAENVIVIPKYDCLGQIPNKFMLGYSVPSSHGGTPLHVDLFRGRRVHLLGGSWKSQLNYLAALGDDVCSIDNNYISLTASHGRFVYPDGHDSACLTPEFGLHWVTNPRMVCLALSFGAIAYAVNELYGGARAPDPKVKQSRNLLNKNKGLESGQTNHRHCGLYRRANDGRHCQLTNRHGRRDVYRRGNVRIPVYVYAA
ncbi:MAG: DUF6610 family protein [Dehalococcoidia bacterium]|jgi:hypothetical protein